MKILQVGKYYPPIRGGMEAHLQILSELLQKREEVSEITVIVSNKNSLTEIQQKDNLKIIRLPRTLLFSVPFNFSLRSYLTSDYDIVHLHMPNPSAVLAYILAKPQSSLILTWHADIHKYHLLKFFYQPFVNYLLKKSKAIIVTNPQSLNQFHKFRYKTIMVPLGIPLPKNIIPKEEDFILFIGRLVHYKGLEYLLGAMPKTNIRLIIIGNGPLKRKLQDLCSKLNLNSKVSFLGEIPQEEKNDYLQRSKMLVLPSIAKNEAFGIVQLEAMAYAKPVISTRLNTGVEFVNLHKKTGLIIPPKNSNALTQAINYLLQNPNIANEYGKFAQERVRKEFSAALMLDKIMEIYKEVI